MKSLTITEKALRILVREALDAGVKPNPLIDDTPAATTDPDHVPTDVIGLNTAVQQLVKNVDDKNVKNAFDAVSKALGDVVTKSSSDKKEEKTMKDVSSQTESRVRDMIKQIISEDYEDIKQKVLDDLDDEKDSEEIDDSPDEDAFAKIASEFGISVSGAKQLVDKTLARYKFVSQEYEGNDGTTTDIEVLVLSAIKDYIDVLASSGELTDEDLKTVSDNPDIVRELDGFREFLHHYVRKSMSWDKEKFGSAYQKADKFSADYEWLDVPEKGSQHEKIKTKAARGVLRGGEED